MVAVAVAAAGWGRCWPGAVLIGVLQLGLVGLGTPGAGARLPTLLRPGGLGPEVLELRLVVEAREPLALARGHQAHLAHARRRAARAQQLQPLRAVAVGDAAEVRPVRPPPLAPADGVGQRARRAALARAHQLGDRLGAAARPVRHVAGVGHFIHGAPCGTPVRAGSAGWSRLGRRKKKEKEKKEKKKKPARKIELDLLTPRPKVAAPTGSWKRESDLLGILGWG